MDCDICKKNEATFTSKVSKGNFCTTCLPEQIKFTKAVVNELAEAEKRLTRPYIVDERGGCVAVYRLPERKCLSGVEDSPDCIYYKSGVHDPAKGWTTPSEYIIEAERIAHEANREDRKWLT